MKTDKRFRQFSIGIIFTWLIVLALLPFILVFGTSFLTPSDTDFFQWILTWHNYSELVNPLFLHIFLRSLVTALVTTAICLILGYPFAYLMARLPEKWRNFSLFLIMIPFWTSSLIRTYAIITIIKTEGLLNSLLLKLGMISKPLHMLYTGLASQIGLIYSLLPFMILPLYAALEKFDWRLLDAARDLGASKIRAFFQIVIPLTMQAILSGVVLVLLPAMTLFYIPDILGGAKSMLLGNLIQSEFLETQNWPLGSAMSVVLTLILIVMIVIYRMITKNKQQVRA